MPVVHCIDHREDKRQLVDLIFPVLTSSSANVTECWHWPEVADESAESDWLLSDAVLAEMHV